MSMTVIQQIKGKEKKRTKERKKIKLNCLAMKHIIFFSLIVSSKWQFTVYFDVVMFSIISEKKSQIIKL